MNTVLMNTVTLNQISLNLVGTKTRKGNSGGEGGTDVPVGYDLFMAADGDFLAADGELYVKS